MFHDINEFIRQHDGLMIHKKKKTRSSKRNVLSVNSNTIR